MEMIRQGYGNIFQHTGGGEKEPVIKGPNPCAFRELGLDTGHCGL
jgi:hypothetical protein